MIGGGFHNPCGLPRTLIERIRDEAQVLAAYQDAAEIPWGDRGENLGPVALAALGLNPADRRGIVHAIGFIAGAAAALEMSPEALLAAAGAAW